MVLRENQVNSVILISTAIHGCAPPPAGTNTRDIPPNLQQGFNYLQVYTYECIEGYETTDPVVTVCRPDGTKSLGTAPTCISKLFHQFAQV